MTKYTDKEIKQLFETFSKLRVLIIGDVMIDDYMWGKVTRISPEAPVPVVSVTRKEQRLGGAAIRKVWLDRRFKPTLAESVVQVGAPAAWAE